MYVRARARTRVIAASARVRPLGSKKPRKRVYLGRAFSSFTLVAHIVVFALCMLYYARVYVYLRPLSFLRLQISRSSHSNGFLCVCVCMCAKSSIFGKLLHSMINRDIHIYIY